MFRKSHPVPPSGLYISHGTPYTNSYNKIKVYKWAPRLGAYIHVGDRRPHQSLENFIQEYERALGV
jgi:hypothetical protein